MEQSWLPGGWNASADDGTWVIGIEIGGRGQRVAVADPSGRVRGEAHALDPSASAIQAVEIVRGLIDQACHSAGVEPRQIRSVGVAFGGPVDADRGVTLLSHRKPGFENFPLVNLLEDIIKAPVVLENDARAAALGEAMYGAARGSADVVYVHLGTGVGGGFIVDGHLLHGGSGTAGEIGHMVVSNGGPICSCGKPGHLEAYVAVPAIMARFHQRLSEASADEMANWSAPGSVNLRSIFERARQGDVPAADVVNETVHVLGVAIANLITVLNPSAVVVGGAVAEVGHALMDPLSARVRQFSYPASMRRARLSAAQFRGDSALLGAIALALAGSRAADAGPTGDD